MGIANHRELASIPARFRAEHGIAYHVSCHSMSSIGGKAVADPGTPRSEFDIGDRHGQTCEPEFVEAVTVCLSGFGYDVTVNEHFAGAESIHKHGNPEGGVHSLQIEINRSFYMDEDRYHRGDKFEAVRAHLEQLICGLAEFARRKAQ